MTHERRAWWPLLWAGLGIVLAAADLTALTTLIPQITLDLEVPLPGGLNDVAWVVSAYLIGNIVALPISGRLADHFARPVVFVACLLVFIAGSIGSAVAPGLWWLVGARTVQALGAGAMVPITMALATDVLPRERWAVAFGVIAAVDTAGWAIGPLYGALFVNWLDWRWLFWVNVPLGLLAAAGVYFALRHVRRESTPRPIDLRGAVLLTLALTTINIGLSKLGGGAAGAISFDAEPAMLPWQAALPWLVGGAVALVMFGRLELKVPEPLINLRWLAQPRVALAALINLIFGILLIAPTVNVPLFSNAVVDRGTESMELAVQQAAVQSGVMLMALTGLMAVLAPVGGALAERLGARSVVLVGAVLAAFGFWLMRAWQPTTATAAMIMHLGVVGAGFGLMLAPPAAVIVAAAPSEERGVASSLVILLRLSGMSIGLSALTAWSLTRFNALSAAEPLTSLTANRIQAITVSVLTSSFAITAGIALIAAVIALSQPRRRS